MLFYMFLHFHMFFFDKNSFIFFRNFHLPKLLTNPTRGVLGPRNGKMWRLLSSDLTGTLQSASHTGEARLVGWLVVVFFSPPVEGWLVRRGWLVGW